MNDIVIDKLLWFMNLPEYRLSPRWNREEFEKNAYVRWTVSELMNAIMDHPTTDASDILQEFWLWMLWCHNRAPSPRSRRQFETALDTLDTIYAML